MAACLALLPPVARACSDGLAEIRTETRRLAFSVEIADTPGERARGLMFRQSLPRDAGMLFVFEDAAPRSFWMENTPISLDMLFFDTRGVLCGLVEEAVPFTRTPRRSGCDARLVLEINGGLAAELDIGVGAALRHPAVGSDAAWACDAP
jgi:uncharacterized membrane protein (UPF0127 family)